MSGLVIELSQWKKEEDKEKMNNSAIDACVHDPSNVSEPYGFVEVKCPYKYQDEPLHLQPATVTSF